MSPGLSQCRRCLWLDKSSTLGPKTIEILELGTVPKALNRYYISDAKWRRIFQWICSKLAWYERGFNAVSCGSMVFLTFIVYYVPINVTYLDVADISNAQRANVGQPAAPNLGVLISRPFWGNQGQRGHWPQKMSCGIFEFHRCLFLFDVLVSKHSFSSPWIYWGPMAPTSEPATSLPRSARREASARGWLIKLPRLVSGGMVLMIEVLFLIYQTSQRRRSRRSI